MQNIVRKEEKITKLCYCFGHVLSDRRTTECIYKTVWYPRKVIVKPLPSFKRRREEGWVFNIFEKSRGSSDFSNTKGEVGKIVGGRYHHSWQRGPNPFYFIKNPSILPTAPLFFQILSNPSLHIASKPQPHCSFCCLVSLPEWVIEPHLMCYFIQYYGSKHPPWYHNTRKTLICVLCN